MFLCWKGNFDSIEAKIEAYGLGSMMGQIEDENTIIIPKDILNYLAEKSNVNIEELIKSFIAGFMNNQKNKES